MEFINLYQRGMCFHEYSLKFTKLLKYAPSLVSDPRDEMSRFVTGVLNDFHDVSFVYDTRQHKHFSSYGS